MARVRRVKFKTDTVHPDHGEVKKGEVLAVSPEYAQHYERLGIAEETDEAESRAAKADKA